jgi:enoyl-CoA hydratase/carnithine racemase
MSFDSISTDVGIERVGRTLVLTIQRPEARNALTRSVLRGLIGGVTQASADEDLRCVVVTGAGGHFCAGADLKKQFADDPNLLDNIEEYIDEYHALVRAIVSCPKPTIAMMDGAAVGFGADIAFACDLRVAADSAYAQEKFVKIGLMPDGGGTFWLPRLIGTARAMQAILFAEKLEAKTLLELGVVAKVVPSGELRDATLAMARAIEAGPPLAHAAIKKAVYASLGDVAEALRREREGQLKLLRSADCFEGIMAWAEKREPRFRGA